MVLRLLLVCNTAFGASFASAQNLLLGATVTDTCMACPQEQFGPPGAITDGDMKTNRNLGGGAPGSFMISLAQPIALGRVVLFPNMTPNGPVSFEIQTSSDPAGSTGTWTSHGGSITRGWVDKQAIDVPLNPSTTGVRKVKVIVYKSPAWVSFYEVEGYSSPNRWLLLLLILPPLLVAGGLFFRRQWSKRKLLRTIVAGGGRPGCVFTLGSQALKSRWRARALPPGLSTPATGKSYLMTINIFRQRFTSGHFFFCLFASFLAYSTMAVMPAYNADDIIQAQPAAQDYYTYLASGRWGLYFIQKVIFDTNPSGVFAFLAGIITLAFAALLSAQIIGIKRAASVSVYILVSIVSLYYASYLSFDSSRFAYSLANLCAIGGLYFILKGRWFVGISLFSIAPSLFQPSIQVAATVLVGASIYLVLSGMYREATKKLLIGITGMLAGLILYYVLTQLSPAVSGIPLSNRSGISFSSLLLNHRELVAIFIGHGLPSGKDLPYYSPLIKAGVWAFMASFVLGAFLFVQQKRRSTLILCAALCGVLLLTPFCLAFVSVSVDQFGPRALIAYATVHAIFIALPMEMALDRTENRKSFAFSMFSVAIASAFLFFTAVQISNSAFDEYLSSRNDFFATNRIISRIDEVVINSDIPIEGPIPLVVIYNKGVSTAPRGVPNTARAADWSREWIFRHIDPRFAPVIGFDKTKLTTPDKGFAHWPHKDSVFIQDGVVVVVIN